MTALNSTTMTLTLIIILIHLCTAGVAFYLNTLQATMKKKEGPTEASYMILAMSICTIFYSLVGAIVAVASEFHEFPYANIHMIIIHSFCLIVWVFFVTRVRN